MAIQKSGTGQKNSLRHGSSIPVVFDIGGTSIRVAALRAGEVDDIEIVPTPESPDVGIDVLLQLIRKSVGQNGIREVVGDISGVVQNGAVFKSPNLPKWNGTNIVGDLMQELRRPVNLFNDAEMVALGEYWYGAGLHSSAMAYVTVSTGVGGALIVDGKVDKDGKYNYEIGHQLVRGKELEAQVSGSAVKKKYGVEPKDFTNDVALHEMAEILAEGLYNITLAWSPDTIVLGGSMITGSNAIPLDHVERTLEKLVTTIYPHAPRIRKATLGRLGGLYGGKAFLEKT